MKTCTTCNETRPLTEFYRKLSGYQHQCKVCTKAYNAKRYAETREARLDSSREYYWENREAVRERQNQYYKANPGLHLAKSARYKAKKLQATFGDKDALAFPYFAAEVIAKVYGGNTPHVDHIVPLKGENVCGLHVPCNLQLLSPEDNIRKSNNFEVG